MSGADIKPQSSAKQRFLNFLETKNLRVTTPRRAIIDAVFSTEDHFTAEQLLDMARVLDPAVSRATVYRTLPLLGARNGFWQGLQDLRSKLRE